jgi:hypothetical protein
VTSLTRELKQPHSLIRGYLDGRFPNVRRLQRPYARCTADLTPSEPRPGARIAYQTLGDAFHWQLSLLADPAPELHCAFAGARHGGPEHLRLFRELMAEVSGRLTIGDRSRARPPDSAVPAAGHRASRASALTAERLARACWALAMFTQVYRAGLFLRSPLRTLAPPASLDELLALPSDDEIADLLALGDSARRALLPALAVRGGPVHAGPEFVGTADLAADADLIVGRLLLEVKVELGDPGPDGRRRCSLAQSTVHRAAWLPAAGLRPCLRGGHPGRVLGPLCPPGHLAGGRVPRCPCRRSGRPRRCASRVP